MGLPEIHYNNKTVRFTKKPYNLSRGSIAENVRHVARNGKIGDLNLYSKDSVSFEIKYEKQDAALAQMLEFWRHAGSGGTFSYVNDPDIIFHTNWQTLESVDRVALSYARSYVAGDLFTKSPYGFDALKNWYVANTNNTPILGLGPFQTGSEGIGIYLSGYKNNALNDGKDFSTWSLEPTTSCSSTTAVLDPSGSTGAYRWDGYTAGAGASMLGQASDGPGVGDEIFGSLWCRTIVGTLRCGLAIDCDGDTSNSITTTIGPEWEQLLTFNEAISTLDSKLKFFIDPTYGSVPTRHVAIWGGNLILEGDATLTIRKRGALDVKASETLTIPIHTQANKEKFPKSGTLMFWYNPLRWDENKDGVLSICEVRNENGTPFFVVYKNSDHYSCVFYTPLNSAGISLATYPTNVSEWMLFAVTWSEDGTTQFMTKNSTSLERDSNSGYYILPSGNDFELFFGPITKVSSAFHDMQIGEITIFSKAFTQAEFGAHFRSSAQIGRNRYTNMKTVNSAFAPEITRGVQMYNFSLEMIEAE